MRETCAVNNRKYRYSKSPGRISSRISQYRWSLRRSAKVTIQGAHPDNSARDTTEIEDDSRRGLAARERIAFIIRLRGDPVGFITPCDAVATLSQFRCSPSETSLQQLQPLMLVAVEGLVGALIKCPSLYCARVA